MLLFDACWEHIEAGGKVKYSHLTGELHRHSPALDGGPSAEMRGTASVGG